MDASVRLSVVVPATDAPPTLDQCTGALHRLLKLGDELIVVREAPRRGPAAARNAGARQASGDVLVFVDADVVVAPDALERIRTAFQGDADLVGVFGSYDDSPAERGLVSVFRNLLHHYVHQQGGGLATTFWAGLGAIRRAAFEASGGFDAERCPVAMEDVELGMRLAAGGARVVLDPAIQGRHLKAWTLRSMVATDLLRRGIPWVALLARERSLSTALNLGWRHRVSTLATVTGVAALVVRRPRTATSMLAVLVGLNGSFYGLLARRRGVTGVAAGVGLHVVHHLVAAASVPGGLAAYLRVRAARPERRGRKARLAGPRLRPRF